MVRCAFSSHHHPNAVHQIEARPVDSFESHQGVQVFRMHANNDTQTQVILAYDRGLLAGSVSLSDGRTVEILPQSGGFHRICEIDSSIPFCGNDGEDPAPPTPQSSSVQLPTLEIQSKPTANNATTTMSAASTTPISVLSILVGYTTDAKNYYGGVSGVDAVVAAAEGYMNDALMRSQVPGRVRIAAKVEITWRGDSENASTETYNVAYDTNLSALCTLYGAPMVSELFHATNNPIGAAYCSTPYSTFYGAGFTFAHEIGHCLGCNHDRANAALGCGLYPYSYGYTFTANGHQWGTIMSYVGSTI